MGEQRRAPGETKRLILNAATELFAAQGYAGTSLREISIKAGVAESVVFRNFGSKVELFKKTVLEPFNKHLENYVAQWQGQFDETLTDEEIFRLFTPGLYDLVMENRGLLLALMAVSQQDEDGAFADFDFDEILGEDEKIFAVEATARGFAEIDFVVATRTMVGAIIGVALLDPWLMPKSRRPSREQIVDELVALCSTRVRKREPASPPRRKKATATPASD